MDGAPSATMTQHGAFSEAARAIVTREFVRAASAADAVAGVRPQTIVEPGDEQEFAAVLKLANDEGLAVIPRGGGTKLDWGNPPKRADVVLSTARLDRVVEHVWADLTVTVEAGCTIQKLQETLARHGQRLALDPLWPERATVGGVLATNDSGALRLRFGALRDLIIGVTLALPDGTVAKSGGKVVKNVAGYDLPKLATGALGTLGVITRAIFRLHPLPKETHSVSLMAHDLPDAQRMLSAIQDSPLAHSALQVRGVDGSVLHVDVLFEAGGAGLAAQLDHLKTLLAPNVIHDSPAAVWHARQELYERCGSSSHGGIAAKISVLPARIGEALGAVAGSGAGQIRGSAVVQATGVGCIFLPGKATHVTAKLAELRARLEAQEGTVVVTSRDGASSAIDAWGAHGDALGLMRAVKRQFDPKSTLNPGRFVGGI